MKAEEEKTRPVFCLDSSFILHPSSFRKICSRPPRNCRGSANGMAGAGPLAVESARHCVPIAVDRFPPGALVAQRGQPISEQQYQLLDLERRAFLASKSPGYHLRRGAALFLVFALLGSVVVIYGVRFQQ